MHREHGADGAAPSKIGYGAGWQTSLKLSLSLRPSAAVAFTFTFSLPSFFDVPAIFTDTRSPSLQKHDVPVSGSAALNLAAAAVMAVLSGLAAMTTSVILLPVSQSEKFASSTLRQKPTGNRQESL